MNTESRIVPTPADMPRVHLEACRHCHQPNVVPVELPKGARVRCSRCQDSMRPWSKSLHNNTLAAVFASAAFGFFWPAMFIPMMGITKFGFRHETGLIDGVLSLFHHGNVVLGAVLLICSVVFPIVKTTLLILLSTTGVNFKPHTRSRLIHFVEVAGRWGVVDFLLVAVLAMVVKLADLVTVYVGPGLYAFGIMVFLNIFAGWAFDPDSIWRNSNERSK